jgi:hypothetical protein
MLAHMADLLAAWDRDAADRSPDETDPLERLRALPHPLSPGTRR